MRLRSPQHSYQLDMQRFQRCNQHKYFLKLSGLQHRPKSVNTVHTLVLERFWLVQKVPEHDVLRVSWRIR